MGSTGRRRRNRNRRLREKEMKSIPKPDKKRRDLIVICIVFGIIALLISKVELENIFLYEQGQTTKAYVYKLRSTHHGDRSVYEFKVSNDRYKGEDLNAKLGDSIQVVYLPQNPRINRNAEVIDEDWCVLLYRKIIE
jgi:hypothetical protein